MGYNHDTAITLFKLHGVRNATHKYKNSPFFNRSILITDTNPTSETYSSKMFGYGVSSFYLSVPECRTSVFHTLPIIASSGSYFSELDLSQANLITSVNLVGNQSSGYRDFYLLNLRDMAFASNRSGITSFGVTASAEDYRDRDAYARRSKGLLICADYDGIGNISFKRLETGENPLSVLWKIPRNIIYYNKAAIALSFKGDTRLLTNSGEFSSSLNRMVRFSGYSELHDAPGSNYPDSNTTFEGQGFYFKADQLWTEWCQRWTGSANGDYRFNEADIDWVCSGLSSTADVSALKLYTTTYNYPTKAQPANISLANQNSNDYFPWEYRPNDIQMAGAGNTGGTDSGDFGVEGPPNDATGHIGTHLLNIDANKLFSEAHNFVPDPTDEYVFRLVVHPDKYTYFVTAGINRIKSSIILEYGFSDNNDRSRTELNTTLSGAFPGTILRAGPMKSVARLDKSNVFVYIKREHLEQVNDVSRYIITLAIRVPRLKSIGYSKVFRAWNPDPGTSTPSLTFPVRGTTNGSGAAASDTNIDSGPWTFSPLSDRVSSVGANASNIWFNDADGGNGASKSTEFTGIAGWGYLPSVQKSIIAGRNECAVKFTRIGIPSTLWIRLSVLNTDGEAELINNAGWI